MAVVLSVAGFAGIGNAASVALTGPSYVGSPALRQPVEQGSVGEHPYMSNSDADEMHSDGYGSNTHSDAGPLGVNPKVTIAYKGPCAAVTVTKEKLLLLQCGGATSFTMRLVDPVTLKDLAKYNLPPRPSTLQGVEHADLDKIYGDSSGAYFYLDNRDRVVLADAAQQIQRVAHYQSQDGTWHFRQVNDWDLRPYLPHDCTKLSNLFPQGQCDPISSVLPDFHGLLWFVTRMGRVGTINPTTGGIKVIWLKGQEIENSHSVSSDGMSIVTDHALYEFRADTQGVPQVIWKQTYDRGRARKPGQIDQGSGTTPTLIGDDYVAITDNADDRMHVLVYRRADKVTGSRLVCSVPVFGHGASDTENSLVAWGDGIVVENNYGYEDPVPVIGHQVIAGGITKVEINADGKGCHTAWTSNEISPSVVPKLSRPVGLLYFYTRLEVAPNVESWYLTAVSWRTGKTIYKVKVGTGPIYDNAFAPIAVGPGGEALVSMFTGVVRVTDS